MAWFVFESEEIIMGPYNTRYQAECDLEMHLNELYLEDDYPSPYIDFLEHEDDYFNWEEMDYCENRLMYDYQLEHLQEPPTREKIRRKNAKATD